ncbi:MAG: L-threonylcarbamoyladenylate synthase [Pseudobdellovibrio sp.]
MSSDQVNQAVQLLNQNNVVAFPTETVYGLGARIDSVVAIKKIFSTKQRPFFDPLIVHVSSLKQAQSCTTDWSSVASELAKAFWPGPLTLVVPKSALISDLITSGLENVGLRWPSHPIACQLIEAVGVPLAAPSANKFGRTSPTKFEHVLSEFGSDVFVIKADPSEIGIESTVLLIQRLSSEQFQIAVLRKGFITESQIDNVLKQTKINFKWTDTVDKKFSPGHMKHHYMPTVPFVVCTNPSMKLSELSKILNEKLAELPDEVEGIKIIKPKSAITKIEFLKLSTDPILAARELYSQLRAASLRSPQVLCYIQLPSQQGEMWESVFDRLYKAASLILN